MDYGSIQKKIKFILALFVIGLSTFAEWELKLFKGEPQWGYSSNFNYISQKWTDKTVVASLELELFDDEQFKRPAIPWQSFLGIFIQGNNTRYTLGFVNWGDSGVEEVPLGAVAYENLGNIQPLASEQKFKLTAGKIFLKATYNGQEIYLEYATKKDGPFQNVWSKNTPKDFKVENIGFSVNSYQESSKLEKIIVHNFSASGEKQKINSTFDNLADWDMQLPTLEVVAKNDNNKIDLDNIAKEHIIIDTTSNSNELLQQYASQSGQTIQFRNGIYDLSEIKIASNVKLIFDPLAIINVSKDTQFILEGDNITIENAHFKLPNGGRTEKPVIIGKNRNKLVFKGISSTDYGKEKVIRRSFDLISLVDCGDITLSGFNISGVNNVAELENCSRVNIFDNRATDCLRFVHFIHGSEFLNYYGNFMRRVEHPCQWWGGDANDYHEWTPNNTQRTVDRALKRNNPKYQKDNSGTFDILVENNIAEYCTTLAWGSKGRNVVINGNIARFMRDIAYDTEGGENVIISNNIAINSYCAGIAAFFYGERLLIANNQLLTFDEGDDIYKGDFIRLHSPGDSQHFGNGEVLITGNQMVDKTGKQGFILVEAARNVVISNNTFRNGGINMLHTADDVIIKDNVFVNDLKKVKNDSIIYGEAVNRYWHVRGNIFRNNAKANNIVAFTGKGQDTTAIFVSNYFENFATNIQLLGAGKLLLNDNIPNSNNKINKDWLQNR